MNELVTIAIQQLPNIIDLIKSLRTDKTAPITDDDVIVALQQALTSSLAKDDQWLAQHPDPPTPAA
jgi:hypothetical protein